ncbi:MAG: cation:proton antiporter, partial [Clostridia bacterium]|nr:cation:proton antiporter [Clostridia bacterium]
MSDSLKIIFSLAVMIAAALLVGRLAKLVKLPNVTAYLVAGLLIGPCVGRLVSKETLESFSIITTIALGFIAFSIGGSFKFANIKKIGGKVITITMFQALTTVIFVDICLLALTFFGLTTVSEALVLGAIATATAPAATLMVVKQYNAKGPVTDALLPVVALDDAVGLMVFAISNSIAIALYNNEGVSVKSILLEPLLEIVLSV